MEQNNITKYSHVTIENNNAMEYSHVTLGSGSVDVTLAAFKPAEGVAEYHAMFRCLIPGTTFSEQLDGVLQAYDELSATLGRDVRPVFKRYFLSDASNQVGEIPAESECAVSVIEQSPLDGTKIALWVYFQDDVTVKNLYNGLFEVTHGDYRHFWQGNACAPDLQSEVATRALLCDYALRLEDEGCTLARNCMRTWFFVQNVDVNYSGVVKGRNEVFATNGLTRDTHFIASTGICGRHADPRVTVTMDTYAVDGLRDGQHGYLYAPDYLNPTYEYGVSFERGAYIDYGDRRHVLVSGTASINNEGKIMYPGDIRRQTMRMWDNVHALLDEAGCSWGNVGYIIVYLRDLSDYAVVNSMFCERFPDIPHVIVLAPVCRPGWLVEMECMAVKPCHNECYARF